ncbi:MAG TPA: tetratricopeptide repeat protein, partial [Firmicutes bacterium]|nr:tetratricopeptide repeat protein [Bacillota bacterium]
MAKRVHELAAELGMRSERLMQLLQREGLRVESALDELDSRTALRIRRELEAGRSRWSRVKTSLGRRMGASRLPSAASLSDEEEEELEELVSRQEDRERPAHVELELDEAETQLMEKTAQPWQERAEVEVVESPVEEASGAARESEELSREAEAALFTPAPSEEEEFQAREEPSFDEEPVLSEVEEEPSAGTEEKALDEESLLATLDRIAQMEEANGRSQDEAQPEDILLDEEPETRVEREAAPTAKMEQELPAEDVPESEPCFSADELLEQQLAAARAQDEQEEPAGKWHGHLAHVEKTAAVEEVAGDILEETSDEVPEEVPEAQPPPEITPEPERQEVETRRASDLSPAGEESESGTVTIDELLGTPMPEEQPAALEEDVAEAKEGASKDELLDTESLLGLEFVEQGGAEPSSGPEGEEQEAEGVRVEELLGVPEAEPPGVAERLSPLAQRLQGLLQSLQSRVSAVVRNPGAFLRSLSNLELVVVSLAFLLTLSGAFYAFYHWYNFNRPGMDERFFLWGEQLRKVGRYEEAIEKYQMVLRYHPRSERVKPTCFGLADARYRLGQFREAIPAYERALALYEQSGSEGLSVEGFPDFLVVPQARLNLARSMLHVGFYEGAKEELVELAAQYPGEEIGEESRLLLGDLYMHWAREENRPEKYQNAVAEYHLALGEYPGSRRQVELMSCLGDAYRALYEAQGEGEQDRQWLREACEQYE